MRAAEKNKEATVFAEIERKMKFARRSALSKLKKTVSIFSIYRNIEDKNMEKLKNKCDLDILNAKLEEAYTKILEDERIIADLQERLIILENKTR